MSFVTSTARWKLPLKSRRMYWPGEPRLTGPSVDSKSCCVRLASNIGGEPFGNGGERGALGDARFLDGAGTAVEEQQQHCGE